MDLTRTGDVRRSWFSEYPSCEWAPALLTLEGYGAERVAQARQLTILYEEDGETVERPPVLQQALDGRHIARQVLDEIRDGFHAAPKAGQALFDRLQEIFNTLLFRRYLSALSDEDMVLVYSKIVNYANNKIRRINAKSGRQMQSLITAGSEAEDLAHQALSLPYTGRRAWPCDRVPLVPFLQTIVKSLISHEISWHRRRPQQVSLNRDTGSPDDASRKLIDRISDNAITPEEALSRREAIYRACRKEPDLLHLTLLVFCGRTFKEIMADLGVSRATVYRRLRSLNAAIDEALSTDRKLRSKEKS